MNLGINPNTGEIIIMLGTGGSGGVSLPDQTGNSGKFLSTDGSTAFWDTVTGTGGGIGTGTISDPYTSLNIKWVKPGKYYLIRDDLESVVTNTQTVDGILTVDGVNTILFAP